MLTAPDAHAFTHQALLYRSEEELVEIAVPFLREGVQAGDAVVVVASPDKLAAMRGGLAPDEAAEVAFKTDSDEYADVGPALLSFQQLVEECTAAGRRVRSLGEPPLGSASRPRRRELCHNEAAANEVARAPGVTAVCCVDLRVTADEDVAAMRRCHPEVVEQGAPQPSPDYTEPATLLAQEHRRPLPPPGQECERLAGPVEPASARGFVDAHAAGVLDEQRRADFVTAVNEIVTNACTHAVMDGLRLWREDDRVVCEVDDAGTGVSDPLIGYRQPETWQTAGWGVWLARQLTHVVEMSTGTGGSTVRLHAKVASPETS